MNDTDRKVNAAATWNLHEDPDGARGHVEIGGVLVFVYFENGTLVISPHFDTASPEVLGPSGGVPLSMKDGNGDTIWEEP